LKEKFDKIDYQLQEQQEINNKLKIDYEHQHFYLVERDENIRLLKLDIEEHKQLLDNTKHNQNEHYSSLLKQQKQLSDLLEITTKENKNLNEINHQLKNDLKENNQLFFEKTKQADDLDKQLQLINNEYQDLKIQFNQIQGEKNQLINDIKLSIKKIQNFEKEKSEYIQVKKRIFSFFYTKYFY